MNRTDMGYVHHRTHAHQRHSGLGNFSGFLRIFARPSRRGSNTLLAGLLLLVMPGLAAAQGNAVRPRVTARVDDTVLTVLHGNTHPLARAQNDQGAVADSQPMRRMLLLLQRGPDQEAALKQLVDQQQSKTSPSYHQWLTPQQFGLQFGPADADIQTVTNWLQSHGFQIAKVSNGRTVIEFSGTAGQVRNAFHTEIHRYLVNGVQHFANSSDPQIPTALAPVVAGTVSLHNFPKKAQSRTVGTFRKTKATGKVNPLDTFASSNYCGLTDCNAVGPGDFAAIYNVLKLWTTGINGHPIDGTNQTIAIVGDSEICTQNSPDWNTTYLGPYGVNVTCSSDDVAQFRSLFGLPVNSPNVILDGPDPGFNVDETEGDLDVEWSGAVAKGATIDYVIAEDTEATFGVDLAAEYVVDNNLAPVLSESYGDCEWNLGFYGNQFEATLWEQAAAQGITVIVSAGDSGSAGCDDPSQSYANQFGAAVNGIASTPFNVAAGGTDFDITASSYQSTYWGPNATVDGIADVSALKYIPETSWNDSCAQPLTPTSTITGCTPTNGDIVAGGGGQSNCAAQDSSNYCYYYAKPSWQTVASGSGLNSGNDLARDLPDISLFAADGYISNSFYIICEADVNPNDTQCNLNTPYHDLQGFDFVGVGGTSSAAPTFAGMMALVNQNIAVNYKNLSARQGNANYVLYPLFASQNVAATKGDYSCNSSTGSNSACTFNDITKGNNSVPCLPVLYQGTVYNNGCSSGTLGTYGVLENANVNTGALTGYLAWNTATGLDLASGLGSVNAYNLVNNWPTAVGAFTPTATTLCLSLTPTNSASCSSSIGPIMHGTTVYVNMQVNANGTKIPVTATYPPYPIPAGTYADPDVPTLAEDVSLVGTFPAGNPSCIPGCTTGGVDHFTSNNYVLSWADIYPLSAGTTVGQNNSTNNLVGSGNNGNNYYNVIAHYAGDGTYGGSDSSPISVYVSPEGSTAIPCVMVVNPVTGGMTGPVLYTPTPQTPPVPPTYSCTSATTAYYGDLVYIRADVIGTSSGQVSATGNATLYDNGVAGVANPTGGTTSVYPLNTEGYLEDQTAFLAVTPVTPHSFRVKYNGDASYSPMTAPSSAVNLTVQAAPTTTQITTPSSGTTIVSGNSVTLTAFVDTAYSTNPSGGSLGNPPTGTVNFISSLTSQPINASPIAVTSTYDSAGYVAATASYTFTPSATLTVTAVYTPSGANSNDYVTSCAGASPCSFAGVLINVGTQGVNATPGCNSSTITIATPGSSGSCLITVAGVNAFAGTVTLSYAVTGEPSGAVDVPTCSFGAPDTNFNTSTNTITLSATQTTGTATMTCSSTAASGIAFRPSNRPSGRGWPLAAAVASVLCLFFLLGLPRQRRWGLVPLAVLLVVVVASGFGCGGGSGGVGGGGNPGTTTGAYTITVTATPSVGSVQKTPITVQVN